MQPDHTSVLDWIDDTNPAIKDELSNRHEEIKNYDELSNLDKEKVQLGTTIPQLYGSLSRFVANPSTVSVETFKRMLDTDEMIGAGIDFLNLCMIARWGQYKHKNEQIQEFVRDVLSKMEGSWHENLDEMLSAEWAGFSLTEQVWKYDRNFDGAPAFVPKKLVTYPPLTIVFAVDRHGEILHDGVYQYQRYHNTFFSTFVQGVAQGDLNGFRPDLFASVGDYPYPIRISADLSYLTVKIPKDHVIHLRSSSTGKFKNPYGRSPLRRIYKNWVMKDAFLKMWIIAADRKGTPLLIGYAAPNDTVQQQNMDPNNCADDPHSVRAMRADQALAATMKTIHNSSFIVLPGKKGEEYEIEAIMAQGDMNVFKDAVDYYNKAIMRGLMIPPTAFFEGGESSLSRGDSQKTMFEKIIDGKLKPHKQQVLDQFISKIITYNFPRPMWEQDGYGEFAVEEQDVEMMEKLSNIFNNLTTSGYMSPEQQADMDFVMEKMNMPKKDKMEALLQVNPFDENGNPNDNPADPNAKESTKDNPDQEGGKDKFPPNVKK